MTQLLSGMKAKKVKSCLYVCYSEESTTIFLCKFDSELWSKIWNEICDTYDCENPMKPIHLPPNIEDMKGDLHNYIKMHVTFLCELPSLKAKKEKPTFNKLKNQYILQNKHKSLEFKKEAIIKNISEACKEAKKITKESFQLCRKKATEILTFLMSNTDREKVYDAIDHVPNAYAMKGSSLKTETMRKMIEDVHNKCKEENVDILCEVCDGQWNKITFQDIKYEPLTKIQFQKKIWNSVMAEEKSNLIDKMMRASKVSEDTLQSWSYQEHILMVDDEHTIGNIKVSTNY